MLHRLIDWHHRVGWSGTLAVVRDGISIGLAALGALLAYLAIRLGKQQATIAEKQAAIAEKQDQIMEQQMSRVVALRVSMLVGVTQDDGRTKFEIYIRNMGNKTASTCYWDIFVNGHQAHKVELELQGGKKDDDFLTLIGDKESAPYLATRGFLDRPIYPKRAVRLGYALVEDDLEDGVSGFTLRWGIYAEDGTFPDGATFGEAVPEWDPDATDSTLCESDGTLVMKT